MTFWNYGSNRPAEAPIAELPRPSESPAAGLTQMGEVTTERMREDNPMFVQVYRADLPRGCKLKVEMRTYLGRRDSSEIVQPNGSKVWLEIHKPADKILDRELLPDILRLCQHIIEMDKAFCLALPDEFIDKSGRIWACKGKAPTETVPDRWA